MIRSMGIVRVDHEIERLVLAATSREELSTVVVVYIGIAAIAEFFLVMGEIPYVVGLRRRVPNLAEDAGEVTGV